MARNLIHRLKFSIRNFLCYSLLVAFCPLSQHSDCPPPTPPPSARYPGADLVDRKLVGLIVGILAPAQIDRCSTFHRDEPAVNSFSEFCCANIANKK